MVGGCKGDECMQWTSTTSMAGAQSDTIGGGSERARLRASEVRASQRESGARSDAAGRTGAQARRTGTTGCGISSWRRSDEVSCEQMSIEMHAR